MKYQLTLLSLAILFLTSCEKHNQCLNGSGQVNEYQLTLNDFNKISLYGPVNLQITQGDVQEIEVHAQAEMFSALSYEVISEELIIGYKGNINCFDTDFGVWVNVVIPDIKAISASGNSQIISNGDLNLDNLDIDISGVGTIVLKGEVSNQVIKSNGTITLNNFDFISETTSINIKGEGEIEISCESTLDIEVSGSVTLKYKGQPLISRDVTGALNLVNFN